MCAASVAETKRLRDVVVDLLIALKAFRALAEEPKKLEEALPWIENDRRVRELVDAAIIKAGG